MPTTATPRKRGSTASRIAAGLASSFLFLSCGGGSPQSLSSSGSGSASIVNLSPASVSFGIQPVGVMSSAQMVTLTNSTGITLSITSLAFAGTDAGDFAEVDTCGSLVAAGANCTIGVMFTPSAAGQRMATLAITDNAPGNPQTVSLLGTGAHDVILAWTASATAGVTGYNVYRGTAAGGENDTPLNATPVNGTTYTDANVIAGATYYYVVTAIAADGITESAGSNEATATVPSP